MHPSSRVRSFLAPRLPRHAPPRGPFALGGLATLAALAATVALAPVARAQNFLYWDLNGFTAGAGGGTTPSGAWTASDLRWNLTADGSGPPSPWLNNSVAIFSAGTNATGSYTITLSAASLPVGGLSFQEGNVTLAGTGTLQLVNPAVGLTPYVALNGHPAVLGSGVTLGGLAGINFNGTGTLTLAGNSTVLGQTGIDGVTVQLGASDRLADSSPVFLTSTGTLALAGFNEWIGGLSGSGKVTLGSGTLTIDAANSSTFDGTISGTGSVRKLGGGALTLTNTVGWTGETWIGGGTLALGASDRFPDAAAITVLPGATFSLGTFYERVGAVTGGGNVLVGGGVLSLGDASDFTFSGSLGGFGSVAKAGTGRMLLTGGANFLGGFSIFEGTLRFGGNDRMPDTMDVLVDQGATWELAGFSQHIRELIGTGTVVLDGGALDVGAGGESFTIGANITGPGTLSKWNDYNVYLSGTFGPTGTLRIQQGAIRMQAAERIGDGVDVVVGLGAKLYLSGHDETVGTLAGLGYVDLGGGDLTVTSNADAVWGGEITTGNSVAGLFTKLGTGVLTLSGESNGSPDLRAGAGTLRFLGNGIMSDSTALQIDAGAIVEFPDATSSQSFRIVTGAGDLISESTSGNGVAFGRSSETWTFDGRLLGSGTFTKTGTGTLTLNGASDPGLFVISEGSLRLGSDNRLSADADSALQIGSAGTLDLNGHRQQVSRLVQGGATSTLHLGAGGEVVISPIDPAGLDFDGLITGTGKITKENSMFATLSGALGFSGSIHVKEGILVLDHSGTINADVQVDAGAKFSTNYETITINALRGSGTVTSRGSGLVSFGLDNSDFAFAGDFANQGWSTPGGLVKVGTGKFTFGGHCSLTTARVQSGVFALDADDPFDAALLLQIDSGGALDLAGHTARVGVLNGSGQVTLAGGTFTVGANNLPSNFSGPVVGPGTIHKVGTRPLVLSQPQLLDAHLHVAGGKLAIETPGAWTLDTATVDAGATLELASGAVIGGATQNAGTIACGAGLTPVRFTGDVSGNGAFTGDMLFDGSYSPGVTPGDCSVGAIHGSLTLKANHTLRLDLGGVAPGTTHDQLAVDNTLILAGTLQVTLRNGFIPAAGQSFQLIHAATITGAFTQLQLPQLPHGLAWDASTLATDEKLRVLGGYAAFVAQFGLNPATNGAPNANPSGDGIPNLLKFLLGGNPLVAQSGLLPAATVETVGATTTLVFSYRRDDLAAQSLASVGVEWSDNLASWTPAADGVGGVTITTTPLDADFDQVVVHIPILGPRGFARLRAAL